MEMQTAPLSQGRRSGSLYHGAPLPFRAACQRLLHFDQTDDAPVASFLFVKVPESRVSIGHKGTKKVKN
jgi:hypothetical protein